MVLFAHYNIVPCLGMRKILYRTVLPYYMYILKTHMGTDFHMNTLSISERPQGKAAHSLAALQGPESWLSHPLSIHNLPGLNQVDRCQQHVSKFIFEGVLF